MNRSELETRACKDTPDWALKLNIVNRALNACCKVAEAFSAKASRLGLQEQLAVEAVMGVYNRLLPHPEKRGIGPATPQVDARARINAFVGEIVNHLLLETGKEAPPDEAVVCRMMNEEHAVDAYREFVAEAGSSTSAELVGQIKVALMTLMEKP